MENDYTDVEKRIVRHYIYIKTKSVQRPVFFYFAPSVVVINEMVVRLAPGFKNQTGLRNVSASN
jgi:hypothetical protein